MKEAAARVKINKLLEAAGWRFFADKNGPANIQLEPSVTLQKQDIEKLGDDFEAAPKGFIDFLLLNEKGFPLVVLEAKAENKSPLFGKEQARKYARSLDCRFILLSNGNLHYFWDLERGNPYLVTSFPTPQSVTGYSRPLRKLREGDLVFAYMKDRGYVGYGKVTQPTVMVHEFVVDASGKKLLELPLVQANIGDLAGDPEKSEWAVGIEWLKTFRRDDAKWFKGGFANQNIVCKLRDPATVAFLKKEFSAE